MLTAFGKFCRKLRIDRGELLKEMAEKLGVTPAYLSAVEIGKRNIPSGWITVIGSIYNLTTTEISEMSNAYEQAVTQVKIDLNNVSPKHRQAAMVFSREFKEMDESEVDKFMEALRRIKNKR